MNHIPDWAWVLGVPALLVLLFFWWGRVASLRSLGAFCIALGEARAYLWQRQGYWEEFVKESSVDLRETKARIVEDHA